MNSDNTKKIVVVILKNKYSFEIDADIFDDVYMEAATRALEKHRRKQGSFQIAVVMECYEEKDAKKADKHYVYNSYFVLVNAGMHDKAEHLRESFKEEFGIDLRKESIRGNNT